MNKNILVLILILYSGTCMPQSGNAEAKRNQISIVIGAHHQLLLDKQASPLLYTGTGPVLGLGYERNSKNQWVSFQLEGGMLNMHKYEKTLQFDDPYLSSIKVAISFDYHQSTLTRGNWQILTGVKIKENLLIDLNYEIGQWPYAFGSGGLFLSPRFAFQSGRHRLRGDIDLPILNVVTDMPFHQIPRIEGEYPDVPSLIKSSTRIPFWNAFQRVDLEVDYNYALTNNWLMTWVANWSWLRDTQPLLMKSTQGSLTMGINYRW